MAVEYIIIGSEALKFHCPGNFRDPKDIDIVITERKFNEMLEDSDDIDFIQHSSAGLSHIVKFHSEPLPREYFIADKQKSLMELLNYSHSSNVANVGVLYSLKKAHIHYPIKFNKHIEDYLLLRNLIRKDYEVDLIRDLNSVEDILDVNPELTKLLTLDTENRLGKLKTPKMNQSTEKFFGKSKKYVKSYYLHDDMHKAVAQMHRGSVIYEKILKAGSEVETDVDKWVTLTVGEKVDCVLEEVYVIALERKILPMLFEKNAPQWTPKQAFDWALMRVCTTLCDGFFREFATRAYKQIQSRYEPYYVETFLKSISKYDRIETDRD